MAQPIETFADLKYALESLTDEQLSQKIRWWGDERGGTISSLIILDENLLQTDEGLEPESSMQPSIDEECEEYPIGLPKGTVILSE